MIRSELGVYLAEFQQKSYSFVIFQKVLIIYMQQLFLTDSICMNREQSIVQMYLIKEAINKVMQHNFSHKTSRPLSYFKKNESEETFQNSCKYYITFLKGGFSTIHKSASY